MSEARTPAKTRKALAVIASTAVVACGICCALPFVAAVALLASAGGILAWFSETSNWLTAAAAAAVASAWLWTGVQSWRTHRRPARLTLLVLSLATTAMAAAWLWPVVEALIC